MPRKLVKLKDPTRFVALIRQKLLESRKTKLPSPPALTNQKQPTWNDMAEFLKLSDTRTLKAACNGHSVGFFWIMDLLDLLEIPNNERIDWILNILDETDINNTKNSTQEIKIPDIDLDNSKKVYIRSDNLPYQGTNFIGRKMERDEIKNLLGKARLLTLTGPGGSGKTRMALQVGREVLGQFPDGVWLVKLASLVDDSPVIQSVVDVLTKAEVINLKSIQDQSLIDTLTRSLEHKKLLLILDNCEHVLGKVAQLIKEVLSTCGSCSFIITTREATKIKGEKTYKVKSLKPDEAAELFQDCAMSYITLTQSDQNDIEQICTRLDRIPLAIRLAAARLRNMPIKQLLSRLNDRFSLLEDDDPTELPHQKTLHATINWSYDDLDEKQKKLFCRLSVFSGGWTLEAAEHVCMGGIIGRREILNLLTALYDKSLIEYENSDNEGRYSFLESIQEFARNILKESEDSEMVSKAHLTFFLALAKDAEAQLTGDSSEQWLRKLEKEHSNLIRALNWSKESHHEEDTSFGLELCASLLPFWRIHGHQTEGNMRLEWAVSNLKGSSLENTSTAAQIIYWAGVFASNRGQYSDALCWFEQSQILHKNLGNKFGEATSIKAQGDIFTIQGENTKAEKYFEEASLLYDQVGGEGSKASILSALGKIQRDKGQFQQAQSYFEEALKIYKKRSMNEGIAGTYNNLGDIARDQGDYVKANSHYQNALVFHKKIGNKRGVAWSCNSLGQAALYLSHFSEASANIKEALEIYKEILDEQGEAWSTVR